MNEPIISPDQIKLCLERTLISLRRQQHNSSDMMDNNGTNSHDVNSTGISSSLTEDTTNDTYRFLQQDPFSGITLQDDMNEFMHKLGDENFCFIMQVSFFLFIHFSSSIISVNILLILKILLLVQFLVSIQLFKKSVTNLKSQLIHYNRLVLMILLKFLHLMYLNDVVQVKMVICCLVIIILI